MAYCEIYFFNCFVRREVTFKFFMAVSPPAHSFLRISAAMKMRMIIIAALVVLGLLAFPTDIAVVLWIQNSHPPKELLRFLNFAEVFGHGIGVAAIMIGTFCLDGSIQFPSITWPAIRWPTFQPTTAKRYGARMLGGLMAGPLAVLLLKQLIDRARPRATNFDVVASVLDTFGTASLAAGPQGSSDLHSFPSGHSATAAALATVLIWKYPQGRLFFLTLAVSACLQRIFSMSHYPSDAFLGAACGVLGATIVLGRDIPKGSD